MVNVIAFHLGNESTRQLRAMARAGGGRCTAADSQAALEDYWSADARRTMEVMVDVEAGGPDHDRTGSPRLRHPDPGLARLLPPQEHHLGWAYKHKNENWSKAYTQKVNDRQAAYSTGTGQWSRYYRRSVRG